MSPAWTERKFRCLLFAGRLLTAAVLSLFFIPASAQQYLSRRYGVSDGLPHPSVFRIFSDKQGFLWFGTDYGLARYDGKTFRQDFGDTAGLLNSAVFSIAEQPDGSKLIGVAKHCLLLLTDTSLRKLEAPGLDSLIALSAFAQEGSVFFVGKSRQGAERLYEVRDKRLFPRLIRGKNGQEVRCIKAVQTGNQILVATGAGLYRIAGKSISPLLPEEVRGEVRDVVKTVAGDYWIGLKNGLLFISPDRNERKSFPLKAGREVNDLLVDQQGTVWISLRVAGLLQLKDGQLRDLSQDLSFGSAVVNDMLEDFEGNIWIATYGAGVFRISPREFVQYPFSQPGRSVFCRALCPLDSGSVLVGGLGQVHLLKAGIIRPLTVKLLKPDDFIYTMKVFRGRLLIGTSTSLISRSLAHPADEWMIPTGALSICIGQDSSIRTGGYNYLSRLDGASRQRPGVQTGTGGRFFSITEDGSGNLICGSYDHVFRLRKGAAHFDTLLSSTGVVNDLFRDAYGRIWVASNNGLACLDGSRIRRYGPPEALSTGKCVKLAEDRRGFLWIATLNGLSYVNLRNLEIARFNGWPGDVILSMDAGASGALYIGTADRLLVLQTSDLPLSRKRVPPLFFTGIDVNGQKLWPGKEPELPYQRNKLSVSFTGLSYNAPQAVEYRYRLLPLDDAWHYTKADRLEFSSLPSGRYRLLLSARFEGGPWSSDLNLPILVETPFWRTWWAITAAALCAGLLLFFITRQLVLRAERRKREELAAYNRIVRLKQQALQASINPHFIFNCLNSIQHYLNEHDTETANDYLADFAGLIRMTLEDAQKAFIPLDREIQRISVYLAFEQLRFGDGLDYRIVVEDGIVPPGISIPNMLLQPFVENAIWHGILPKQGKGTIEILFRKKGPQLQIVISDDGVGLGSAGGDGERSHLGISLTAQRLAMLEKLTAGQYRYEVRQRQPGLPGVEVEITVPCRPAAAQDLAEE